MRDPKLRKALDARRAEMDEQFDRWKPYFQELRKWISPSTGRFEADKDRVTVPDIKRIIDSKARMAQRTLSAGLMAGMTSPSRPWFRLGLYDKDLQESSAIAAWLHDSQSRMYDVLRGSNVYRMLESSYRSLGTYGVFGGCIVPNFESVVHAHSFPMGSYRIAEDETGRIAYLHRDCRMTVGQTIAQFGYEKCSGRVRRGFDRGDFHSYVNIQHAIERRMDRDPTSPLGRDKVMASIYWEDDEEGFLEIGGFSVPNILAPRWEQTEGEVWSTSSPGMNALGDTVQLQGQHRDKALAIQKMHNPPLVGAQSNSATFTRNVPGGVTTIATNDLNKGGLRPIYEVRPDVQWLVQDINETRDRISQAFFEDLFLMTAQSDRRQVTAREIAERHEEKLLVLGPVLESLDHALLSPLIEATFYFMQEAEILPPPPPELDGTAIKVEYISALAQAQKAVGVAPIERTIGFVATIEQIRPGAMDNIDTDEAIREFANQVGPPPQILRSKQDVDAKRKADAEAAQAQQMLEQAQPLASAASLISEASARGVDGLQRQGRPL